MDDLVYVVGAIVGIAMIIGFFCLWSLVSQIRDEIRRQTHALMFGLERIGVGPVIGWTGIVKTQLAEGVPGQVDIGGDLWECRIASGHCGSGRQVRVLGREGIVLVVEAVPADARQQ